MTAFRSPATGRPVFVAAAMVALGLLALPGCKKEDSAGPAAPPAPASGGTTAAPAAAGKVQKTLAGVKFAHPADWKPATGQPATAPAAESADQLDLEGPASASGERPYLSIKVRPRVGDDLSAMLEGHTGFLSSKRDFIVRKREVVTHPNGFDYAFIEYNNTSELGEPTPLRQWWLVALLPNKKIVEMQAISAEAIWSANESAFKDVLDSLVVPK
jgi:hypothetical protein